MKRWETWLVVVAVLLVGGSGLVYAWMRYLVTPSDPWSVVNHPWQPAIQHLHVLTAPLLVFAVGLVWRGHVLAKWGGGQKRWTGLVLAVSFGPMIASGYLLQTTVDESWHRLWVWTHVATSLAWLVACLPHLLLRPASMRA